MAKIGIDLNEVLRSFLEQIEYTYNKYDIGGEVEVDIAENQVTNFNLIEHFPFSGGTIALNKFMYEEAALEIFGHADQLYANLINRLNLYYMETVDNEEDEIWIVGREAMNSIPATLFFLSKTACRVPNIKFVVNYETLWSDFDILITANPTLIETKPEDKVVIKIDSSYNGEIETEYHFIDLFEFMDSKVLDEIKNKKI